MNTQPHRIDRLTSILRALTQCGLIGLFVAVLGGCALLESTVDLPVRAVKAVLPGGLETEPVDPIDLQEDMLRFADNFVLSTSKAAEKLTRDGQPITFAEWGYLGKGKFQRRDFRLDVLTGSSAFSAEGSLFARLGKHELFTPIKTYSPMTIGDLADER